VELKAGQIVTVDWRKEPDDPAQDPQPPEPNKLRPAVVVQDTELFDPAYPTVLVVPMTGDPALACSDLTCVAKTRISAATKSQITSTELQQLRQLVVLSIGGLS
jgi:mRNA-degrading endonuclease toxin of MazEF toxin-antitoxin module